MSKLSSLSAVLLILVMLVGITGATGTTMWGLAGLPLSYYGDLLSPWSFSTIFSGKITLAPYKGEDVSNPHAYFEGMGGIGGSYADRIAYSVMTSMYMKRIHDYYVQGQSLQHLVMSQTGLGDSRISLKGKILEQDYAKFDLGVIFYVDIPTGNEDVTQKNDGIIDDPLQRRALNNLTDGKHTWNIAIIEALSRSFYPKKDPCFEYDLLTFTSNAGFVIRTGEKMYSDTQSDYILNEDFNDYGTMERSHLHYASRSDYFLLGGGVEVRPIKQVSAFADLQFRIYTSSDSDIVMHPDGKAARHFDFLVGARFHHSDLYSTTVGIGKTFGKYSIDYTTGEPTDQNFTAFVTLNSDIPAREPDSDGDGMPDCADKCPYEAEDFDGFQDSDGCPDPDNDGDGILDVDDDCPNDPEDKDGWEDEDGCPDPDNDGDGILDVDDDCPNEPETFNNYEDEDGCPDEKPIEKPEEKRIILRDIRFEPDKAIMLPGSYSSLEKAGQTMVDFPDITVTIEGHAATTGRPEFEQTLSEKRAETVKNYIVDNYGVDPDRISTVGFGSTRPISSVKAENRRIEFLVD